MAKSDVQDLLNNAKVISTNVAHKISKTAKDVSNKAVQGVAYTVVGVADKVSDAVAKKAEEANKGERLARQKEINTAITTITGTFAEEFLSVLGESPIELTKSRIKQVKETFPIPREQCVIWADAEFDLRPSGIAITEKGIYIKSNVGVFDDRKKANRKTESKGKSQLFFYCWDEFEPVWFSEENESNKALMVESKCSGNFIQACKTLALTEDSPSEIDLILSQISEDDSTIQESVLKTAPLTGAAVLSAESAVFTEYKAHISTPTGHGEMAEDIITKLDRLHGLDAKVIGRDNAKDGADRQIGEHLFIQTKYYNSARGSLEASFNPETGMYRYMNDGSPMQLEVPKDQYERVLEGFKYKIKTGKVPGVTNPNEATNIVRKGRLTYKQAVNLTKPGTIDSLSYDALSGAVICSSAFGITFVVTTFLTWRRTGDLREAIQAGASAGIQVFGISFLQHMVVSQLSRTNLASTFMGSSQFIVGKLGYHTSATIVNGIRAFSGKGAIYGVAASRQLAKILRSNVLTSTLTFVAFSVPDSYRLASKKISAAQYTKNLTVLTGSIAGGASGAVATGLVAAKIAGATGTAVAPGVGTAVGIVGGFVGGAFGAKAVDIVGDILHEDDIEAISRLFNAMASSLVSEFLLADDEMDLLIEELNGIKQKDFMMAFQEFYNVGAQENAIRNFLEPHFETVASKREHFPLPSSEEISSALAVLGE